MALFFESFIAFPVNIFSGLLIIIIIYWCTAAFGLFDIDLFNLDSPEVNIDGIEAGGSDVTEASPVNWLYGYLSKLGLSGVPFTLIISLIILYGWIIAYYCQYLFLRHFPTGGGYYLLGCGILLFAICVAIFFTALTARPLRPLFKKFHHSTDAKSLTGKVVEIRSSYVSMTRGEATYEDGGAGMILQVRTEEKLGFKRGDRAVILQYDTVTHSYSICSETEFNTLLKEKSSTSNN